MTLLGRSSVLLSTAVVAVVAVYADLHSGQEAPAHAATGSAVDVPLKDAKLNIEHNATDRDTGFQGFVDSDWWQRLEVRGPAGDVLAFEARAMLAELGLTELFFESVEPENADVPIDSMLARLPEGKYMIAGPTQENGRSTGQTSGTAWLTHDIPAGPKLRSPREGATVPVRGVVARWKSVSKTITGKPVKIIAYQLIIEKDVEPHRHMIGKIGLSMYLPPSVTHRGAGRIPPAAQRVRLGGAGDRAQRQPDALVPARSARASRFSTAPCRVRFAPNGASDGTELKCRLSTTGALWGGGVARPRPCCLQASKQP